MFINAAPFYIFISQSPKSGTIEHLYQSRELSEACLQRLIPVHERINWKVATVLADPEFHPHTSAFPGRLFKCSGAYAHAPNTEEIIWIIEDQLYSHYHNMLPFVPVPCKVSPRYLLTGCLISSRRHVHLEYSVGSQAILLSLSHVERARYPLLHKPQFETNDHWTEQLLQNDIIAQVR